ncbi:MAG TPA: OmpA family protein [Syntrophales bacterium]|nr:OmpA family protein [Syntrophales bacterium]HOM07266.1 OmpA family protein [Syntrophales bacterium]HON99746.1 OmpA family protein [Syntrophales bacterium]HPC01273.1 OmpA family protein [Syntrophales bacterium]HPQ06929.1 OmpA family protein [Syntrophales bacterium]
MKGRLLIALTISMVLVLGGCYTKEEYMKKASEAETLQQRYQELTLENAKLRTEIATLTGERNELDRLLKARSDELLKDLTEARQKTANLEAENAKLRQQVGELRKKEALIEEESKTYKDLVKEMKGEIAKGQITITELKGKLTMDVVDKILFSSGEATVKKEGLSVLDRVVDVLKNVKDKNIRIEGHTDNVKITGRLAKVYPTNWELSAARAINVTRYLQAKGIAPEVLSAVAYGEYKPLADNKTAEGRAKNRRIAIVLVPKD